MLFLDTTLLIVRECVAALGVLVIAAGAVCSLYYLCMLVFYKEYSMNYIRLQFGTSIILGLEFMVGADIIGSLVAPDYYNLGLLLILVVIRTILSTFLSFEIASLQGGAK